MEKTTNRSGQLSPDITMVAAKKKVEAKAGNPTSEETADKDPKGTSKIRRSSRIKKLETRRGGARRREVVSFSSNSDRDSGCGTLSRSVSVPSMNDDDSLSNGIGVSHFSTSTPALNLDSNSPSQTDGCLTFSTCGSTSTWDTPSQTSSTMKLKSRWRHSLDSESFKSVYCPDGLNELASLNLSGEYDSSAADPEGGSGGGTTSTNSAPEFKISKTLVTRSGYITHDVEDTELLDKLTQFEGIEENLFRTERKMSRDSRGMVCDCYLTQEDISRGEIGCNEDCLNRLLMVECGSRCPVGSRCTNKKFQRKEYCPLEVFKTDKKGHGLRTLQPLPEGGFVIEYVGEVLDPREFKHRTKEYAKSNHEHFYFMALKSDEIIDATLRGNCSRFINHSCEPNCETQKWTVNGELRIGFFAIRDLEIGEEITFDYQFQRYGKQAQQCFCLTPSCRGWIGGENEDDQQPVKEYDTSEPGSGSGKVKVKAEKKRKKEIVLEDMAFEEELAKLEQTGLMNKNHTLTLCRLMVRAEDWDDRERILNILINGEKPCRRLFLDYHGLRLLWGWMLDLPLPAADSEIQTIRTDCYHLLLLKTLSVLPIPNKSLLQESKVLLVVEKWSFAPSTSKFIVKKVKPEISEATSSDSTVNSTSQVPEVESVGLDLTTLQISSDILKSSSVVSGTDATTPPEELESSSTPPEIQNTTPLKLESESNSNISPEPESELYTLSELEPVSATVVVPSNIDDTHRVKVEFLKMEVEESTDSGTTGTEIKEERPEQMEVDVPAEVSAPVDDRETVVQESSWEFVEVAKEILSSWAGLQEVFRIPKRERVEQMKEHEREADIWDDRESDRSFSRTKFQVRRLTNDRRDSSSRYRERDLRDRDYDRDRDRLQGRPGSAPSHLSNLSKEQRRNLFAAEVERIEREGRNKQIQEEMVELHQKRCAQLGLDVTTVPIVDTGCNYFLEPSTVTWTPIDLNDPNLPQEIAIIVHAVQYPVQEDTVEVMTPEPTFQFPPWPEGLLPPPPIPPLVLPPSWKMSVDDEGRCYYYHIRTRHTQWFPPSPDSSGVGSDSSDSAAESEEEIEGEENTNSEGNLSSSEQQLLRTQACPKFNARSKSERSEKRKKTGLVQERIISPRTEDDKPFITQKSIRARKVQLMEQKIQEAKEAESRGMGLILSSRPVVSPAATLDSSISQETKEGEINKGLSSLTQKRRQRHRERNKGRGGEGVRNPHTSASVTKSRPPHPKKLLQLHIHERKPKPKSKVQSDPETQIGVLDESAEPCLSESLDSTLMTTATSINAKETGNGESDLPTTTAEPMVGDPAKTKISPTVALPEEGSLISPVIIPGFCSAAESTSFNAAKLAERLAKISEKKSHKRVKSWSATRKRGSPENETTKKSGLSDVKVKGGNTDDFRSQIANAVVQYLNPYRKPSCKAGHIVSTEDFKHLARKLTHMIMLKELKHARAGKLLVVNDNVRHKMREFVKKYMAKFGERSYIRSPDESHSTISSNSAFMNLPS